MLLLLKYPYNTVVAFGTILGSIAGHYLTLPIRSITYRKR